MQDKQMYQDHIARDEAALVALNWDVRVKEDELLVIKQMRSSIAICLDEDRQALAQLLAAEDPPALAALKRAMEDTGWV